MLFTDGICIYNQSLLSGTQEPLRIRDDILSASKIHNRTPLEIEGQRVGRMLAL